MQQKIPPAQWVGLLTILGGILWVGLWTYRASMSVAPPGGSRPGGDTFDTLVTIALGLIMIGLTGAYLSQARRIGLAGNAGIGLLWAGLAFMAIYVLGLALDVDVAYIAFLGGALMMFLGLALFVLATLRAGALPRSAAALLIVGAVAFAFVDPEDRRALLAVPFGVAWAWVGYILWRGMAWLEGGPRYSGSE